MFLIGVGEALVFLALIGGVAPEPWRTAGAFTARVSVAVGVSAVTSRASSGPMLVPVPPATAAPAPPVVAPSRP